MQMAVTDCQNNSHVTGVETLSTNRQSLYYKDTKCRACGKPVILLECVIVKPQLAPQAEARKAQKRKEAEQTALPTHSPDLVSI